MDSDIDNNCGETTTPYCGDENDNCVGNRDDYDPEERRSVGDHTQPAQTNCGDPVEDVSGPLNSKDERVDNCGDDREYQSLDKEMNCGDNTCEYSPEMGKIQWKHNERYKL